MKGSRARNSFSHLKSAQIQEQTTTTKIIAFCFPSAFDFIEYIALQRKINEKRKLTGGK